MESWIKQLEPIIKEWRGDSEEPLDGDSVKRLTEILEVIINLSEGNITGEEYDEILQWW